jgi:hypothetical protein
MNTAATKENTMRNADSIITSSELACEANTVGCAEQEYTSDDITPALEPCKSYKPCAAAINTVSKIKRLLADSEYNFGDVTVHQISDNTGYIKMTVTGADWDFCTFRAKRLTPLSTLKFPISFTVVHTSGYIGM